MIIHKSLIWTKSVWKNLKKFNKTQQNPQNLFPICEGRKFPTPKESRESRSSRCVYRSRAYEANANTYAHILAGVLKQWVSAAPPTVWVCESHGSLVSSPVARLFKWEKFFYYWCKFSFNVWCRIWIWAGKFIEVRVVTLYVDEVWPSVAWPVYFMHFSWSLR